MNRPVADLWRRAGACAVDAAVPLAVAGATLGLLTVAGTVVGKPVGAAVTALWFALIAVAWIVILSAMQAGQGSPGMRAFGIRLIGSDDLRPVSFGRTLLRNVVWLAGCVILVGPFSPLFDGSGGRQGWHDRVAHAIVVQRRKRTPVMPQLPPTDRRASEWLAAMSITHGGDTGPITDVPVSRINHYMTTGNYPRARVIDEVAGPTGEVVPGSSSDEARRRKIASDAERMRAERLGEERRRLELQEASRASQRDAGEGAVQLDSETQADDGTAQGASMSTDASAFSNELVDAAPAPTPRPVAPMPSRADVESLVAMSGQPAGARRLAQAEAASQSAAVADASPSSRVDDDESTAVTNAPASKVAQEMSGVRAVATVVWDDGMQFRIYSRTVFGRNPDPGSRGQIATIYDNTLSLSKTHFEISRTADDRAEIVDLHSTNGVMLRREGRAALIQPGEPTLLRSGDVIEIGSRRARVEVIA